MRNNHEEADILQIEFEAPGREEPFLSKAPREVIELQGVAEPTRKRRGEAAEAAFLARATQLGFRVCLPWGDSERYDSVVTLGHGFLRVQVKSATRYLETRYRVKTTGASGTVYTDAEIDFFVAYIVPEDIWYIIPIAAIGHRKGARFYPYTRNSHGHFEKYREAWCLLACHPKARGWKDIPLVCRCKVWKSAAPSAQQEMIEGELIKRNNRGPAAKRRKNAAHGVSRECQGGTACPSFSRAFAEHPQSRRLNISIAERSHIGLDFSCYLG